MTFLDRLREAAEKRHPGRMGDTTVVNKKDLQELIHHFDRLDREVRFNKLDQEYRYPEFAEVIEELDSAIKNHAPMNSAHEGYAVIKEELEELWDEIKKRNPDSDLLRMEARQVAAMGIRFMIDILRPERGAGQ